MAPSPDTLDTLMKRGTIASIAFFLLWFLTQVVVTKLDAQAHLLSEHASTAARNDAVRLQLLRGICYGVTDTPGERAMCEAGGR